MASSAEVEHKGYKKAKKVKRKVGSRGGARDQRSSCRQGTRVRPASLPARVPPPRPLAPRLRFLPLLVRDAAAAAAE